MGNIPLAAVLYDNGVSFAGIMAFIFSDLVVLPVLRIQAQYYGWRMALYILGIFLIILVSSAMLMHYGFAALDLLPDAATGKSVTDREFFALDYTLALNLIFIVMSAVFLFWHWKQMGMPSGSDALSEKILFALACLGVLWLVIGLSLAGVAAK